MPAAVGAAATSGVVFAGLLCVAAWTDLKSRRIPNAVVAALLGCGVAQAMFTLGVGDGLAFALKGMLVGFGIWILPHVLGILGAGDVKLMAAASSWLGVSGSLRASGAAALFGGALALVMIARAGAWRQTTSNFGVMLVSLRGGRLARPADMISQDRGLPYGVAIAAGALLVGLG